MSSKKADQSNKETGKGELAMIVEDLLESLSTKFDGVSSEIFAKMDEMARRLDDLEASLRASEENNPNSPSKSQ